MLDHLQILRGGAHTARARVFSARIGREGIYFCFELFPYSIYINVDRVEALSVAREPYPAGLLILYFSGREKSVQNLGSGLTPFISSVAFAFAFNAAKDFYFFLL